MKILKIPKICTISLRGYRKSRATNLGSENALIGLAVYTLNAGGLHSGGLESHGPPIRNLSKHSLDWAYTLGTLGVYTLGSTLWGSRKSRATNLGSEQALIGLGVYTRDPGGLHSGVYTLGV